jgi:multimeric flavodoxin WrbA
MEMNREVFIMKKILFINGLENHSNFKTVESLMEKTIEKENQYDIDYFKLRDMNINYCTGCWDCWLKTPGRCAIKDDHEKILKKMPHSDIVIYFSPIIAGYYSALIKKLMDRMIPLAHPYIKIVNNESHHVQRYKKLPDISMIILKDGNTEDEDISIIKDTINRIALNFDSQVNIFKVIEKEGDVLNVFNSI